MILIAIVVVEVVIGSFDLSFSYPMFESHTRMIAIARSLVLSVTDAFFLCAPRVEPAYQELLASEIPKAEKDGVSVSVIAGESLGISSPVFTRTPSMYLDFTLQPGASISQPVPEGWNGFAYTLNGTAVFDDVESGPHHTLQLGPGDGIKVENKGAEPARFVLIAGKPLNEPVVQHGPFVMNTREEIMQTFNDYQYGRNGFERAHTWVSS